MCFRDKASHIAQSLIFAVFHLSLQKKTQQMRGLEPRYKQLRCKHNLYQPISLTAPISCCKFKHREDKILALT